jgi:hypothetical protein
MMPQGEDCRVARRSAPWCELIEGHASPVSIGGCMPLFCKPIAAEVAAAGSGLGTGRLPCPGGRGSPPGDGGVTLPVQHTAGPRTTPSVPSLFGRSSGSVGCCREYRLNALGRCAHQQASVPLQPAPIFGGAQHPLRARASSCHGCAPDPGACCMVRGHTAGPKGRRRRSVAPA